MRTWRSPMSAASQGAFVDISYIIKNFQVKKLDTLQELWYPSKGVKFFC